MHPKIGDFFISFVGFTITLVHSVIWNHSHDDASYKYLGAIISQNSKPILFLSGILINPQSNFTTTDN